MTINTSPDIHELVIIASVFVLKGDKILMIRRSDKKTYLPNYVQPVGGKVDLNEDPLTAAHRELMEETQIKVTSLRLKAVVTEIKSKKDDKYRTNWQIFHFSGRYEGEEGIPLGKTEEGELLWLTLDEIKKEKIADSIRFIIDSIVKEDSKVVFAKYTYDAKNQITAKNISSA